MNDFESPGCQEYNDLSRRQFLRGAASAALASTLVPAWLPQVSYAQHHSSSRDTLVSLYLRGGTDGLSLCVPYGDPNYYAAGVRPTLAVARPDSRGANRALDLDGFFGLPPAMAALRDAYNAKHLLMVHATGSTSATHSHFDAQRYMEVGKPEDINLQTGWLGRHLASVAPLQANAPLRALSLGFTLPTTLAGADKTTATPNPDGVVLADNPRYAQQTRDWLNQAYAPTSAPVQTAASCALQTLDLLHSINFAGYVPANGVTYPNSLLGRSLKSAAALIKAQVGVEAIHTDYGLWDTHSQQGVIYGYMAGLMQDFAQSLGAFHADVIADKRNQTTLVAVSEFGRTVQENASQGTDHGHGNVMFLMGGDIKGGRVLSKWPGLHHDQLYQGADLQVTIDHRDILAEVVAKRLGNANLDVVFPGYAPTFQGVTV